MTSDDDKQLILATIDGIGGLPDDVIERIGDERALTLIAAATTVSVAHKFGGEPSPEQVDEYVAELQQRFPNGSEVIKTDVAKAVILGSFGHEDLLSGIAPEDMQAMLFVLPYAIMSAENLDDSARDQFVEETVKLVD